MIEIETVQGFDAETLVELLPRDYRDGHWRRGPVNCPLAMAVRRALGLSDFPYEDLEDPAWPGVRWPVWVGLDYVKVLGVDYAMSALLREIGREWPRGLPSPLGIMFNPDLPAACVVGEFRLLTVGERIASEKGEWDRGFDAYHYGRFNPMYVPPMQGARQEVGLSLPVDE